jgi:hypothetical protein
VGVVLILVLFPILYLIRPRLALVALLVGIAVLYFRGRR